MYLSVADFSISIVAKGQKRAYHQLLGSSVEFRAKVEHAPLKFIIMLVLGTNIRMLGYRYGRSGFGCWRMIIELGLMFCRTHSRPTVLATPGPSWPSFLLLDGGGWFTLLRCKGGRMLTSRTKSMSQYLDEISGKVYYLDGRGDACSLPCISTSF